MISGRGIILVVDDEQVARSVAKKILEKVGYIVLSAQGGLEGLDIFSRRYPDITAVLLDLSMPDLNGQEVLQRMLEIQPSAQVILSSGYHEQSAMAKISGLDLAGFVSKPYQPTTLIETLQQVLNESSHSTPLH